MIDFKIKHWVSVHLCNPLKTWKKAKKYFKKPKVKISFFSNPVFNCPFIWLENISKILDIESNDVMWKEKYDSPRHERSPYIWVCFFKRFGFSINWHIYYKNEFGEDENGDMFYWEYLLSFTHFNKPLTEYQYWVGNSKLYEEIVCYGDKPEDDVKKPRSMVIPVIAMSLNKNGIKELKNGKRL